MTDDSGPLTSASGGRLPWSDDDTPPDWTDPGHGLAQYTKWAGLKTHTEQAVIRLRNGRTNTVLRQAAASPCRSITITDEIRAKYK